MLGHPVRIFGVIIVEAGFRLELGHRQRLVVQHRDGEFAPTDERLGEQPVEMLPRTLDVAADRIAVIAVRGDDRDAHRAAFVDRLQHIGARKWIGLMEALALDDLPLRHADAVGDEHQFGQLLVDRDHRSLESAMGIAEAHQVHHALYRPVLAGRAVQRVEHHIGRGLDQPGGDIALHIDPGHAMAAALQRVGDARAGHQRDLPLRRPAAHQDRDMKLTHDGPHRPSPRRRPGPRGDPRSLLVLGSRPSPGRR